jgi:Large polyvalent protein-associated domain 7
MTCRAANSGHMATILGLEADNQAGFQEFLETRNQLRATARTRIADAFKEYQERVDAIGRLQEALIEEMKPRSLGERMTARIAVKKQSKRLRSDAEQAFKSLSRDLSYRYGLDNAASAVSRDYEDFAYTVADAQDRGALDPVLTNTPGARKTVDQGWTVYFTSSPLWGKSELVRANGDAIVVRGHDDARVRAGLLLAKANCQGPLRIQGNAAFVSTARRIAGELGLDLEGAAPQPPTNTISGKPRDNAPGSPAEESRDGVPPRPETSPTSPQTPTIVEQQSDEAAIDVTPGKRALSEFVQRTERTDLMDFTEPAGTFEFGKGRILETTVIDGRTYALLDMDGNAIVVALDQEPAFEVGAEISASVTPEGTTLNAATLAPEVVAEHADVAARSGDGIVNDVEVAALAPEVEPQQVQAPEGTSAQNGRGGRRRKRGAS